MTQEFASTKAETAGVVAVFHAVPLLTGPLATWLTDRLNIYHLLKSCFGSVFLSCAPSYCASGNLANLQVITLFIN